MGMAVVPAPCAYEHEYFISYPRMKEHVRQDHLVDEFVAELATKIRYLLTGSDVKDGVFLDVETLRPGMNWEPVLARAVHHSRCFVAVLTQDYPSREYCQRELAAIQAVQKTRLASTAKHLMIVPILLRADRDNRNQFVVPAPFRVPQWADFTRTLSPKTDFKSKSYSRRVQELIDHLGALKALPLPRPAAPCDTQALPPMVVDEVETPERYSHWGPDRAA
jgi:hypothetical protein